MKIESYHLEIPGKIKMSFLNLGGIIQYLHVPDKNGMMGDIVLGFDNKEDYQHFAHPYFGSIIGRYANRIAEGLFRIDGKSYQLILNDGENSLHGGLIGLDKVFWQVQENSDKHSYTLTHEDPNGRQGYPGNVKIAVTYTLSNRCELVIDYHAVTDAKTIINLTNHTYFNLGDGCEKNILEHELWINANFYTEVRNNLIPTGNILEVNGPNDFRKQKKIGKDIGKTPTGYDHNYVLNEGPLYCPKARLIHEKSGRMMEVFTTEPGMQFYSGNLLDGTLLGKNNTYYQRHQGLCLETQHFPDSPNHPNFPSTELNPGEIFKSKTIYKFCTLNDG